MRWSKTDRLVTAYKDGYTVGQAARYAGLERRFATVMLRRLGIPIRQNNHRQHVTWTEDHDALLRQKHSEGVSFSLIADALNAEFSTSYSRNAAIGRAHRLGLSRTTPASQCRPRKSRTRQKPMPIDTPNARSIPPERAEPDRPSLTPPVGDPAPLSSNGVSLMDLQAHHCRYIAGDPLGETPFCGAPAEQGQSYCPAHMAACYGDTRTSEQRKRDRKKAERARRNSPKPGRARLGLDELDYEAEGAV